MPELKILISHAYDEKALAEAWATLLQDVSLGVIKTWFSSDQTPSGGMDIGQTWREQIYERLSRSDEVIAIQTPTSAGRPWIMWECGIASGINKERGVIPIVFAMGRGELNNPIAVYQAYQGEDKSHVREACERLVVRAGLVFNEGVFEQAYTTYHEHIQLHQPRKAIPSEHMSLWRTRFEELVRTGRLGEVFAKRQAMYASPGAVFTPIDPALHELLSKILLDTKHFAEAIDEIDKALSLLAGEDIDLLHRKALALVEQQSLPEAEGIVNQILKANAELRLNPELAALEGRIFRERWQTTNDAAHLDRAFEAYHRAYEADPTNYFTGINAASLALAKQDTEGAERLFNEIATTCQALQQEPNASFWTDFSVGEAQLGLGNIVAASEAYRMGLSRMPPPSPREKGSALNAIIRMGRAKGLDENVLGEVKQIFAP